MAENNNTQNNWEMYQPDLTADHPRHQGLLEPLISLYQDGEASEEETATVEQYLLACAECRAVNAGFQSLSGNLAGFLDTIPARRFDRRNYPFLDEFPASSATVRNPRIILTPGAALPANRDHPVPLRQGRTRFAYNLAGGMAAALLIGLVAVFLLLVSQQVNQGKGDQPGTSQAVLAGQTEDARQTQTAQAVTSPNPSTTTPPATEDQATPTSEPTTQPTGTPNTGATLANPSPAAVITAGPSKTQAAGPTQKPLPTITPLPVPTNTPISSKTTAASVQSTATPTSAPVETPTGAPATAVVATAGPVTPAETTSPAPEITTTPATQEAPTITPAPATPTPGDTSAAAPGWIAYVDQSDGQIHLVKADGSDDQVISDPTVNRNLAYEKLAWSNDGKMLVAVGRNTNNGSRSIYLLDIANPLRVEELAEGFAPSWSPDNLSIAFLAGPATTKNGTLSGKPAIYSLRKRTVTTVNTTSDSLVPQWFADSTRLLIGQDRIYNSDSDSISTFKLPFTNTCLAASLSPAGDKLANLELQADGTYQTVIYDLSKGQLDAKHPLAKASAAFQGKIGLNCGAQRLSWTPTSRSIYYFVNNGTSEATCLVQANGGGSRCLTNVYDPSFNNDGSAFVDISLTSSGDGQVYTAASDVLARPPRPRLIAESAVSPVWQPV